MILPWGSTEIVVDDVQLQKTLSNCLVWIGLLGVIWLSLIQFLHLRFLLIPCFNSKMVKQWMNEAEMFDNYIYFSDKFSIASVCSLKW